VLIALAATTQEAFNRALMAFPRGALNAGAFARRGTIEFRLQGGTINYVQIRNWTLVLLALVNRAKTPLAQAVPLTINQPRPDLGFATRHVFTILGLAPSRWAPTLHPICALVEQWTNLQRARLAGTDERITF
jgi:hypothetical protein